MAKRLFVVLLVLAAAVPILGQSKPVYYIFTPAHYSFTRVLGDKPRVAPKDAAKATVAELQEADRFAAQFGSYEVKGDTIVLKPIVAHSAGVMNAAARATWNFKLAGNTLTITTKNTSGAT